MKTTIIAAVLLLASLGCKRVDSASALRSDPTIATPTAPASASASSCPLIRPVANENATLTEKEVAVAAELAAVAAFCAGAATPVGCLARLRRECGLRMEPLAITSATSAQPADATKGCVRVFFALGEQSGQPLHLSVLFGVKNPANGASSAPCPDGDVDGVTRGAGNRIEAGKRTSTSDGFHGMGEIDVAGLAKPHAHLANATCMGCHGAVPEGPNPTRIDPIPVVPGGTSSFNSALATAEVATLTSERCASQTPGIWCGFCQDVAEMTGRPAPRCER